ncbi:MULTISPECIES: Wzz/FepE/Etk N-terminal domain-containing protein [Rhizobium]|uniref:Wzz/FepE/Etk N-terminal domain-containing protein n=1 Tax=Rhizobium rhododendri TaxID=2506430 RepID=A0ABY8INL1_9HYPH|nr:MULTISPECIES: Wzz/FepE/Etk N-terminal domain-containing protein [Rhizobium]MBO9135275.1 exopolysaccharide biosynthesis protein [Rhizobium sp. B209b/85]MBO9171503.1 exopolysaccharide biosynthesis protein [Rhizobium sp. L245/93]MBO9187370.1 exopolysaccharide biosynthesis protein [Rhizobium sp. E27B/91]MBZ5762960.1 exopolysaccharide biosynthesis protein [Rhizobium sp. VS19-DR96]MBZ5768793.1 exopolysaccharide biosynthesis protein [Rhizobium sp. VS19-DR129.2]
MTNNSPQPWERASRLWRFDTTPAETVNEGPLALLRSAGVLATRHKYKLVVFTTVGLAFGVVYAHSLPKVYTATATLLLEPRRQAAVSGQDGGAQGLDLNRADSELQIIRSERLLSTVFDTLELQKNPEFGPRPPSKVSVMLSSLRAVAESRLRSAFPWTSTALDMAEATPTPVGLGVEEELRKTTDARQAAFLNFTRHIEARRLGQSYVIEIDFSSSERDLPAVVANAAVSAYILQSVAFKLQMAISGTEALQWRLDALNAQVDAATTAIKNGALPAIGTPDADARVIGAALAPLSPSGPRTSLIIALGGVLGLLIGLFSLALNLAFNRKIRSAKELARETGVVCLGILPDAGSRSNATWRSDGYRAAMVVGQPRSPYAAAVRNLRTSIEIACSSVRSERSVVVAIASWDAPSGASTLCLSLAQLISHSGRHVTLFKADVNELPDNASQETSMATNLADILIADVKPEEVIFTHGDCDDIAVLPIHSKNAESNLFADFRDRRVSRLIETARISSDVLLDLPPLTGSTDALALAIHADAVVVVVTEGRTTIDEAIDTIQQLRRAGANVIGTVLNRAKA